MQTHSVITNTPNFKGKSNAECGHVAYLIKLKDVLLDQYRRKRLDLVHTFDLLVRLKVT